MKIEKWDFKTDGYHPHEPGLRKKLNTLGFDKVNLRECKPGVRFNMKNSEGIEQAMAFLAGRIFVQFGENTEAMHQGDILILSADQDYRFKTSGDVVTKILQARKITP